MTNGEVYEASQCLPFGALGSESQDRIFSRIEDKFRFEAAELLPPEQIEEAIAAVRELEQINPSEFIALLTRRPSARAGSPRRRRSES